MNLTSIQKEVVNFPINHKVFLEGPAGTGKTTAAVERVLFLLSKRIPADSILIMVPQRILAEAFHKELYKPGIISGGDITIITLGGLARRMVDIFWPVVADRAGFLNYTGYPNFLTMETAQYFMAHLVKPELEKGMFESVNIEPNRLYSQILDNLNKSAIVGFSHTEIGDRLKSAWSGDPGQVNVYDDVQYCVSKFRVYCLENNLLDFSLQIEVFVKYLWNLDLFRRYFFNNFKHFIADNLEEDTPVTHDILITCLNETDSAVLVMDKDGGYRRFLGADPHSANHLKIYCDEIFEFDSSLVCSDNILSFQSSLSGAYLKVFGKNIEVEKPLEDAEKLKGKASDAFELRILRYYPSMIDWAVDTAAELIINENSAPDEIVILAPYVSDSLRFMVSQRFNQYNIPMVSHRPSRPLREEPAARCLITLACLAYPEWNIHPPKADVTNALMVAIKDLDLVRAHLLTQIVYRDKHTPPKLSSFSEINPDKQERITYRMGEKYERLRNWLENNQNASQDFDYFLNRLFGEVLSQPGYGFFENIDAGRVAGNLAESIKKFSRVTEDALREDKQPVGKEYVKMVQDGVIAAQYIRSWKRPSERAVYIAPAFTFLMANRPVDFQIWLDVGSRGWYQRLYQPLTQPYILSRNWLEGKLWTDKDEVNRGLETLERVSQGLLKRCRKKVYLGISELGEQGYEHRSPFLQVLQHILLSNIDV